VPSPVKSSSRNVGLAGFPDTDKARLIGNWLFPGRIVRIPLQSGLLGIPPQDSTHGPSNSLSRATRWRRRGLALASLESSQRIVDCAQFCAHPQSKTIAFGNRGARVEIACIGAENQRDSETSHSVLIVFGRSLNQRVVGSSPTRFTTTFNLLQAISKL
jgi:hypothetical protein